MAGQITRKIASGDVSTDAALILSAVTVTAGADGATAQLLAGGSGGTAILTLKAIAETSTTWFIPGGVVVMGGLYVTLAGTDAEASIVHTGSPA